MENGELWRDSSPFSILHSPFSIPALHPKNTPFHPKYSVSIELRR